MSEMGIFNLSIY